MAAARDLESERGRAEALRARGVESARAALAEARRQGLCGAALLFGSYAWGEPTAGSDLDLLVAGCADPDWLAALVARTTGTEVHVVCAETAPASLRDRALAHGTKL